MRQIGLIAVSLLMAAGAYAGVEWMNNYDEALVKAKKEKKLVMVDVYTDWCGWCKKLDKNVYAQTAIADKLAKGFVAVKINPEKSEKNKQLARQFGTQGYPHIVFLDGDGKKVSELKGYRPAEEFGKLLDAVVKKASQ